MIIKTTHINNGSHGYLSVSKKDFIKVCEPSDITTFSGHDFTRIYLEEDQDADTFLKKAEEKGYEVKVKMGYNLTFAKHHNYNPELFDYKPELNDIINSKYKVIEILKNKLVVIDGLKRQYKISLYNPFKYIQDVIR